MFTMFRQLDEGLSLLEYPCVVGLSSALGDHDLSALKVHEYQDIKVDDSPSGYSSPNCGCRHFYVVYTRPQVDKIVRRKECRHCGRRITTCEKTMG